jgi:hypothetical protein
MAKNQSVFKLFEPATTARDDPPAAFLSPIARWREGRIAKRSPSPIAKHHRLDPPFQRMDEPSRNGTSKAKEGRRGRFVVNSRCLNCTRTARLPQTPSQATTIAFFALIPNNRPIVRVAAAGDKEKSLFMGKKWRLPWRALPN